MAKIAMIGDEMTSLGMKLVGIKKSFVADAGNVQEVYDKAKEDADIIVVTHSLFESLKQVDKDKITARIPDRHGGGEDTLGDLVKQVVGFEVKA
jgi:vacuolar-type H+-ATPase subunit F/Vma7